MSQEVPLYGISRHAAKPRKRELASSSDLSFSAALSTLISSSSTGSNSRPSASRSKRLGEKNDIFTKHNRNTKKRALADLRAAEDDPSSELRWKGKDAAIDDASWRRTRRKMEDKARLYAAMKRGDVEDDGGDNPKHMVDFDRKWADRHDAGEKTSSESDDDDYDESDEELVEYTDSFGRTRHGTRAEVAREQRRAQATQRLRDEEDRYSARPNQPSNVIVGDTIQTAAFNPDEPIAVQMEELASKRDREPTPPSATHYDADAEIRTRGTGFFQFSRDEETRKQQMEELEKERKETERLRADKERDSKKDERKRAVEQRRRQIMEKRGQKQADSFLQQLESEIAERNEQTES